MDPVVPQEPSTESRRIVPIRYVQDMFTPVWYNLKPLLKDIPEIGPPQSESLKHSRGDDIVKVYVGPKTPGRGTLSPVQTSLPFLFTKNFHDFEIESLKLLRVKTITRGTDFYWSRDERLQDRLLYVIKKTEHLHQRKGSFNKR